MLNMSCRGEDTPSRPTSKSSKVHTPSKSSISRQAYAWMYLVCIAWLVVLYYFTDFEDSHSFRFYSSSVNFYSSEKSQLNKRGCPGVLRYMTSGTWYTRPLTSQEKSEMFEFFKVGRHFLPDVVNYERPDRKCGNLTYVKDKHSKWFRVLCNPGGPTPCCFNYLCMNKTEDECRGPFNYDLRSRLLAEYSTWKPLDQRCVVKLFHSQQACTLLKGSTIFVVGDSLMRGIYTALIQILTGDLKTGALKPNTPNKMKKECAGIYSYHHKWCSKYLDFDPKLCNGSLKIFFRYYGSADEKDNFKRAAVKLKGKQKSMVFVGIGLWDHYNYDKVKNVYLSPTLQELLNNYKDYSYWPKILWASAHHLGIWRYPFVKGTDNVHGKLFNDKMAAYLSKLSVPVFDTFKLTEDVMTIDGTHFAVGINMLKAQLYLNYMQELKDHQLW